jgi:hypothetical protein
VAQIAADRIEHALVYMKLDVFNPRPRVPLGRWLGATAVALTLALLGDTVLARLAAQLQPSLSNYPHFQFHDYAKLTIIGVVFACVGWLALAFVGYEPRWLYFRLSILGTLVLYLPDLWLLVRGQPAAAVGTLVVMHLAVIVAIYFSMTVIAGYRSESAAPAMAFSGRSARSTSSAPPPS